MKIEVYVNGNCSHCLTLLQYLLKNGLSFTVKNISQNNTYIEELKLCGCLSVPSVVYDQKQRYIWQRNEIDETLINFWVNNKSNEI